MLIGGTSGNDVIIEIEPCRLWPPVRSDIYADRTFRFYGWIFREEPELKMEKYGDLYKISYPFSLFENYRRTGFPMRFNVRTSSGISFAGGVPWQERLLQRDWNPSNAAWLIFD